MTESTMEGSTNTCTCGCGKKVELGTRLYHEWLITSREKQKGALIKKRKRAANKPQTPAEEARSEKQREATTKLRAAHPRHPCDQYPIRRHRARRPKHPMHIDFFQEEMPEANTLEALEAGFDPYEEEHIWDQGETVRTVTVRETTTRSYSEHLSQPELYLDPRVVQAPVKEKGKKKK